MNSLYRMLFFLARTDSSFSHLQKVARNIVLNLNRSKIKLKPISFFLIDSSVEKFCLLKT